VLPHLIDPIASTDRRERDRIVVRLVVLAGTNREARSLKILDISSTGCLVEIDGILDFGEDATVEFPGGYVQTAKVVWCQGEKAGLEFTQPLSKAVLSSARLRSDHLVSPATGSDLHSDSPAELSHFSDVPDTEKLPRRWRMLINLSLISLPWVIGLALALAL